MNRRNFLKLMAATSVAPALPVPTNKFGVDINRQTAKMFYFAFAYGAGKTRIAELLEMKHETVEKLIAERFNSDYPFYAYLQKGKKRCS